VIWYGPDDANSGALDILDDLTDLEIVLGRGGQPVVSVHVAELTASCH